MNLENLEIIAEIVAKIQGMSTDLEKAPDVAIAFDVELPIVVTKNWEVASYVKGYQVYERVWTPISNEVFQTRREPENPTDKYAVCLLKDGEVVEHLKGAAMDVLQKQLSFSYEVTPMLSAALRLQESR